MPHDQPGIRNVLQSVLPPDAIHSSVVRRILDDALGPERVPTGSLLAHVLHDVFLAEARQLGFTTAARAWSDLNAATIDVLADRIRGLFRETGAPDLVLPAGSSLGSLIWPSIFVGAENLGFDVDRPGLHPIHDLPEKPGGSNLDLLFRRIGERCELRPCRAIGMPELVTRYVSERPSYRLQFPPFDHAGGVVLERRLDFAMGGAYFCAMTPTEIDDLAAEIVTDMVDLWNNNRVIAPRVMAARDAARRVVATIDGADLRAITVELATQPETRSLGVGVEFDALDEAYRPGVVCQHVPPDERPFDALSSVGLLRSGLLTLLKGWGANGMMHGVARAIAQSSREGLAALLIALGREFEVFATLGRPERSVTYRLFWSDGVIHAESRGTHPVNVCYDRVIIQDHQLPESALCVLRDRALRDVTIEPFECDTPIAWADNRGGNIVIELMHDPWLVCTDDGVAFRRHDI